MITFQIKRVYLKTTQILYKSPIKLYFAKIWQLEIDNQKHRRQHESRAGVTLSGNIKNIPAR